jgi:hypothetical protein
VLLVLLLLDQRPKSFRVTSEVELLRRFARVDIVLGREKSSRWDKTGKILRRLWAWIHTVAVVEFKSVEAPLRKGDLAWWLALVHAFYALRLSEGVDDPVQAVLIVVSQTPTLREEAERLGLSLRDEGEGYWALDGASFRAKVVVLEEAAQKEPLLGMFCRGRLDEEPGRTWVNRHFPELINKMGKRVDQIPPELIEMLLAKLPPEQRLKGLAPEQRLRGLEPDEILLALPDDILAGLSPEALASVAPATRRRIAARLRNGVRPETKRSRRRRKASGK